MGEGAHLIYGNFSWSQTTVAKFGITPYIQPLNSLNYVKNLGRGAVLIELSAWNVPVMNIVRAEEKRLEAQRKSIKC